MNTLKTCSNLQTTGKRTVVKLARNSVLLIFIHFHISCSINADLQVQSGLIMYWIQEYGKKQITFFQPLGSGVKESYRRSEDSAHSYPCNSGQSDHATTEEMKITGKSGHSTDNHAEASINDQINIEKRRIKSLEKELKSSRDRLNSLNKRITSISPKKAPDESSRSGALLSVAEKISLFRNLFQGRQDVYPKRWVSSRTGRSGYSPVCGNKWDPAVCGKTLNRRQENTAFPCF